MFDVQHIAEIREMKERWVIPPQTPTLAVLDCDDEIREWLGVSESPSSKVLAVAHHDLADAQIAVPSNSLTLKERFLEHAAKWEEETRHLSSTPKRVLNSSYQAIMAMGPAVVPLLLDDLRSNRRDWFWALFHLTQVNPIKPSDAGNKDKMIAAWVNWGKANGKL